MKRHTMALPLIAWVALALLGGSASVWTTCSLFFQGLLLLGYGYAHLLTSRLSWRNQWKVHGGVLAAALLFLPLSQARLSADLNVSSPILWLLSTLCMTVAVPFFVVSTTNPLLQRWFSLSKETHANDPYFLSIASNVGSTLGLLSYPFVLEPLLSLEQQTMLWAVGYGVVALLLSLLLFLFHQGSRDVKAVAPLEPAVRLSLKTIGLWVGLSFVPSSLMLSATTHISTDLAAVPLLWMVPLTAYIASFVLGFSSFYQRELHERCATLAPFVLGLILFCLVTGDDLPLWVLLSVHWGGLFFISCLFHGELFRTRPPVHQLTQFYLYLSVGGFLGALFNALLAPLLFKNLTEYFVTLLLAVLLLPGFERREGTWLSFRVVIVGMIAGLVIPVSTRLERWIPSGGSEHPLIPHLPYLLQLAIPILLASVLLHKRLHFRAACFIVLLIPTVSNLYRYRFLLEVRNFYGTKKVAEEGRYRALRHGTTNHGEQRLGPKWARVPISYYHATGPLGDVFKIESGTSRSIGVVGLGAGGISGYGNSGDTIVFYEIDPDVISIAEDFRYFTYLASGRRAGVGIQTVLGDGRMGLQKSSASHDVLILDAFSSDAIPMHLMTLEATKIYFSRLKGNGSLVFHISNKYLSLSPVLARIGRELGVTVLEKIAEEDEELSRKYSHWVVLNRAARKLARYQDLGWEDVPTSDTDPLWRDDFSNLLSVISF